VCQVQVVGGLGWRLRCWQRVSLPTARVLALMVTVSGSFLSDCRALLPATLASSAASQHCQIRLSPDETGYQRLPIWTAAARWIHFFWPRCTRASEPARRRATSSWGQLVGRNVFGQPSSCWKKKSARSREILVTRGAAWQASDPLLFYLRCSSEVPEEAWIFQPWLFSEPTYFS